MQRQARVLGALRLAASIGLTRGLDAEIAREAPPEYARAYRAILLSSRERRVAVREMLMVAFMQGAPPGLDSIPLTVLTRAPSTRWDWPAWARMQDELAVLSSDSEHIKAQAPGTTSTSTNRTWLSRRSAISSAAASEHRTYRRKARRVRRRLSLRSRRTTTALPQKTPLPARSALGQDTRRSRTCIRFASLVHRVTWPGVDLTRESAPVTPCWGRAL